MNSTCEPGYFGDSIYQRKRNILPLFTNNFTVRPNNILIQKDTIKLADFGQSYLKGSDSNTEVWGIIPYVDPKALDQKTPYKMNEKSDIYSLAVIFWKLTSRSSPFNYERIDHSSLMLNILNGLREKPISNTNNKIQCWQHEPDDRLNIQQVFSELALINPENSVESTS
ncbi:kinase-like domain-containing protein [Rhizophagus diaphanus]|nr:kinase-like domain-containing protein [Rhizophagus diaphanus] [Rhizophagus sp. MUCL 43196]